MVGYPVSPESMVLGLTRLPGWARLIMVVRDNNVLSPEEAGELHAGDYAYFLVPPDRIPRLDRLFGAPRTSPGAWRRCSASSR
jgi:potassium/hydrogen antiporter